METLVRSYSLYKCNKVPCFRILHFDIRFGNQAFAGAFKHHGSVSLTNQQNYTITNRSPKL